jgi:hypothetical protein
MWFVRFLKSMPGRALRVGLGLSLIAYGGTHASLLGLVLMMVGMVPAVTGLAGICLIEEVIRSTRTSHLPVGQRREHHA